MTVSNSGDLDDRTPAIAPFLTFLEQSLSQVEPLESSFLSVAIEIAGSWEKLVNFAPSSFAFTDDDIAELSELFAEIEAEEAQQRI